ncbi:MAG TPA: hypothetical protein VII98_10955 [Solirubrobacteraceae bacterium]
MARRSESASTTTTLGGRIHQALMPADAPAAPAAARAMQEAAAALERYSAAVFEHTQP